MAGIDPYATTKRSVPTGEPVKFDHPPLLNTTLHISPKSLTYAQGTEIISDKLYSGVVEHLGRGIYGGIVDDPAHPSPEDLLVKQDDGSALKKGRLGWRKDVMKVLAKDGELEMPLLRWPGGNFVSNYHWQDAIGPIENRPKRVELAWLSTESNLFGTDEFIDYCRALKAEPSVPSRAVRMSSIRSLISTS
jgi:alpha-N-arabinofuranosidase